MSKFLKTMVNIILIGSILVSAGLLIPPFLGVTTIIVDDLDMETNLPIGSVTYGVEKKASELKIGDKVLMTELEAQNLYEVTAIQNDVYSLEDQLSIDGQSKDYQLNNLVKKVLLTVPFMGYISMALKTTEGLIIVGLVVVFVIILFILAEIWKKDDDEEEIAEEDQEDEKEEEESQLTKRQQKKAKKLEAKEAKKAEKTAKKEAKKSRKKGIEPTEGEFETVDEIEEPIIETVEEASEQKPSEINEQSLIEETSNSFAADIKEMMGDTSEEMEEVIENEISEEVTLEEEIQEEKIQEEKEPVEEKKLAIPVYTKEELLAKAEKAGEVPVVRKDEYSGITIIDYSDIL